MSAYYHPQRIRNLYDPLKPFKLSRSKLDLFINCPRCFYFDRKLGVGQPPGYPFTLNSAVDVLLKKEFDYYRQRGEPHPLMLENGIEAIPLMHPNLDEWRDALRRGIQFAVPDTNLIVTGGVDDVWVKSKTEELIIVDYKSTSKSSQVNLDAEWQIGYKRQAEIYQWLFRQNGFKVCDTAYFVYCNGRSDVERFDKQLIFDITLIPYLGNTDWISEKVQQAFECLRSNSLPLPSDKCDFCLYTNALIPYLKAINE